MLMLQLPKSLEIFLAYLMHSPQGLKHSYNGEMWWTQWTSSSGEFFFSVAPAHFRKASRTRHGSYTMEKAPEEVSDVGITCNISGKENKVSDCPACCSLCHKCHWWLVGLSSLLPGQLSWLLSTRTCYQVWKEKRFNNNKKRRAKIRPSASAPGVIGLETLIFRFFKKAKFLPWESHKKPGNTAPIIAHESIHVFESAGSLKNSSDAETGSVLQWGASFPPVPDGSPRLEKKSGGYLQLFISYYPSSSLVGLGPVGVRGGISCCWSLCQI